MKIAVTSTGKTLESEVDPHFGRATSFIIIDTETMDFNTFENDNVSASGGAGIKSAKSVIGAGVAAVLTGNCGPNAQRTLSAGGVQLYTGIAGTVSKAVELFKSGRLKKADSPNVEPHFGTGN